MKAGPEACEKLASYKPGKHLRQAELETGVRCIKMASNENPFGPSPLAIEALKAATSDIHFYPDTATTELIARLAEIHEIQPKQILATAGSTTFLEIIARTLLGPGLNAVTSKLSFIVYPLVTNSTGARLIEVPTLNDGYDLERDSRGRRRQYARRVPGESEQSYGNVWLPPPKLTASSIGCPPHVITVLDEAYYEFANYFAGERGIEYSHSLDYVRAGRPVVVLRTFSKAQGLAGIRVGYGMGPAELMSYFARMRPAFMVSSLGETAALASLADVAHVQKAVENNASGAEMLTPALTELGIRVVPTWANFLYCELGEESAPLCKLLEQEGIIVRPMSGPWGSPNAFRISIGTREQNHLFLETLRNVRNRVPELK